MLVKHDAAIQSTVVDRLPVCSIASCWQVVQQWRSGASALHGRFVVIFFYFHCNCFSIRYLSFFVLGTIVATLKDKHKRTPNFETDQYRMQVLTVATKHDNAEDLAKRYGFEIDAIDGDSSKDSLKVPKDKKSGKKKSPRSPRLQKVVNFLTRKSSEENDDDENENASDSDEKSKAKAKKSVKTVKAKGTVGHALLTFKGSNGRILVSAGHWVELSNLSTSEKEVFTVLREQFGAAKATEMYDEYCAMPVAQQSAQLQSYGAQIVQKSAPCAYGELSLN